MSGSPAGTDARGDDRPPPPPALRLTALFAALAFALTAAGVVDLPDLGHALAELSDNLGTWTSTLVGGLAFLETRRSSGCSLRASRGRAPRRHRCAGRDRPADRAARRLGRRRARRSRLVRAGPELGAASCMSTAARRRDPPRAWHKGRELLRPPRREGDPRRALRRDRARGLTVPGRCVWAEAPRLPALEHRRHRDLGGELSRSSATRFTARSARPPAPSHVMLGLAAVPGGGDRVAAIAALSDSRSGRRRTPASRPGR